VCDVIIKDIRIINILNLFREHNGPVCIASPAGGMDIEQVAKDDPKKIQTTAIDIMEGLSRSTAESIAKFLEFDKGSVDQVRFWILFQVSSQKLMGFHTCLKYFRRRVKS
jgi:succinyl-CoA synthetase beta subunit